MKLKLSILAPPPMTLKNGLAMKTGNYRPGSREQVSERGCEECDRDEHLQSGPKTNAVAVKGKPTSTTKYRPSNSAISPSHMHAAATNKSECIKECYDMLGTEDNCRSMGTRPDCGSVTRGRSTSTSSSDSTSTTCTISSDFDGCNSSSGTSSTNNTSENSSSNTSRTNANNPFTNKSTSNMSSSASEKSSNSNREDILPTLKCEKFQSMKKRGDCAGLILSGVRAWGVSRPGVGLATPHTKVTSGNAKFNINKKVKGISLKNKTLNGKTKNKNFSIKSSSLRLKTNTIEGKTTSLNAKTTSLSFKTNSLNTKTNSLSSNSSCDSKTSSSSTNSSKNLRSLFLRGNVFSSSFTFGNSNSKSSNTDSRALSTDNTLTNTNIVIIGDKGVGKSAIAVRFLTRRYISEYSSGTEMMYQHETRVDHELAHLHLLDAASAQTPHQILRHLAWADAFIVVYDVTSRTSFIHARQLLRILHTHIHALSYPHASSDREENIGSVLDIHPQRNHDIHSKNGIDEHTLSSHDSYAVCGHDTLARSVLDTHIPECHDTYKMSTSNEQISCRHNTNRQSGLNTHIQNSHSINTLDGCVAHTLNSQETRTRGDIDTSTLSNHGAYNHCAKSLYQNKHTYFNLSHPTSQFLHVSHTKSSCRYYNAGNLSVALNPEVSSLANTHHYCQAPDNSHHFDTSSQPLSHTSHRPNNYHRRISSQQVDSYGHHANNHTIRIYRRQCQSSYNYVSKQNQIIDKRSQHSNASHKLNTHDHYPNKYECVNSRNCSQNAANTAELISLHSSVFDIKHDQDKQSDRDTCGKSLQNPAHLSNTSCQTQRDCESRSFAYINAAHSCQTYLNSNHRQQRNHSLNHSHSKSHKHKQSHPIYNTPIYSHPRGHCSSHNQPIYHNLDRSHPEDCNPGHSYLKSHRNGHSHLKNHSLDCSEPRIHSLNQNNINCSPNNISNNYIADDHSHVRNYSSCHSYPNSNKDDQGHLNIHNLNHSHVRDHNPAYYHINKRSNSRDGNTSHNNPRGHSPKHSHQEDHNPNHKHPEGHRSDHSQSKDDKPDPSHPQDDSPEYSHPNLDDNPDHSQPRDHKHRKGHTTLLLGNKRDLEHFRCVWTDEGEALSLEFSCQFYEVSAADSLLGVHLAFHSLLKEARALQLIRRLPQRNPKVSKSVLSSAVSKVIGNFFTRAGSNSKQRQSNSI